MAVPHLDFADERAAGIAGIVQRFLDRAGLVAIGVSLGQKGTRPAPG